MINLIFKLNGVYMSNEDNSDIDDDFYNHVYYNLIHEDTMEHLPIPCYSFTTPLMSTSFMLHIMLSMGRFETEIDLLTHSNIKECLRKCKLIGPNEDSESLKNYANNMLRRFIEEQMQYFPNSQRVIDLWIITTFNLFRKIIIEDSLPISEMPPIQLSTLLASTENAIKQYAMRKKLIQLKLL